MKTLRFLILFGFLAAALPAAGQIQPPNLLCLSGDTLVWELPVNNCGPFENYQVFVSSTPDGPFSLLTTITNPGQTTFVHPNPANETFYYYMISSYDCPGQVQIPSDTLDNLLPLPALIKSVSVAGDNVEIDFFPSPSPEVYAYIIYRLIGANVDIIDTVFSGNTYVDTGADPNGMSELYYVLALDQCGNSSIFVSPHSTLFLEAQPDSCARAINLAWNSYQNWPGGVGSQEIWVSVDGGPAVLHTTLPGDAQSYAFPADEDLAEYCLFVRAREAGSDAFSNSNIVCAVADILRPVEDLTLINASFLPDQSVELTWSWNPDAEVSSLRFWRTLENSGVTTLSTIPGAPAASGSYADNQADPGQGPWIYQLLTEDTCGDEEVSNNVATVFLQGAPLSGALNRLEWTPFGQENGTPEGYEVYRVVNGIPQFRAAVDAQTLSYEDPVDAELNPDGLFEYEVAARGRRLLPDGQEIPVQSRSNRIVVEQFAEVFVPNAFAPFGLNQVFRPAILFGGAAEYRLLVYDRYGGLVFESADPATGWDGRIQGGDHAPQGAYTYLLTLTQQNGRRIEKSGVVVLLR